MYINKIICTLYIMNYRILKGREIWELPESPIKLRTSGSGVNPVEILQLVYSWTFSEDLITRTFPIELSKRKPL